jgi:hypothetical protein
VLRDVLVVSSAAIVAPGGGRSAKTESRGQVQDVFDLGCGEEIFDLERTGGAGYYP